MANGARKDSWLATDAGDLAGGALPSAPPPGGMPAIAMFHSVSPYDEDPYLVTVTPERFDRQMRWPRRRGLRGVSVSELMAACRDGNGRGLIGLTFDDGYADFIEYALPVLAALWLRGHRVSIACRLAARTTGTSWGRASR